MTKILIWLMAGAALTLAANPVLAGELAASQQAAADAAKAPDGDRADRRTERREVRVYRMEGPHGMMRDGVDRAEHLTTMLQLRSDQKDALKTFLNATVRTGAAGAKRAEHGAEARTTPERLAEMEAHLARQQTAIKARIEATRTFYAKLDEKQRKVFDAMPMLMMAGPGFGPMVIPIHQRRGGDDGRREWDQKPRT
ncbi:Spy/CpxP family protein refolding chaperone [Phenylobacterium sp.]|jgi:hypothetical protein|uniref:Spy/CpxP family protein refolding chaperone n=1 Tax=Phenylobacterium sp. TaxID=1871053 RepID=UPI0037C66141